MAIAFIIYIINNENNNIALLKQRLWVKRLKYIIFDLEFNAPYKIDRRTKQLKRGNTNPLCPQEIIEIGAVKVNTDMEIESVFQQFVKPTLYLKLHPKVKSKTHITLEDIEGGTPIQEAIALFREWIAENEEYILCSWGADDINELKRNCGYFKIDTQWIKSFKDIQRSTMKYLGLPMGQQLGLKKALEIFEITLDNKLHKALNDAEYTAKILRIISSNDMNQALETEEKIEMGSEAVNEDN